ncbi:MAG: hypothetical protein H7325_09350 [Pedobacter sp.]|nr:hypothetical protein [Pedobacter sp.]
MSRWMIYAAILLSGCGIHKEKTRLKTDTVNELQSNAQWKWTSDWKNEDYQFKDSSSLAMVFIKADAPFTWQPDSGLSAQAGNYALYLLQRGKSLTAKKQLGQQEVNAKGSETKKERIQTLTESKAVTKPVYTWLLILSIALLTMVGAVLIWRRFKS